MSWVPIVFGIAPPPAEVRYQICRAAVGDWWGAVLMDVQYAIILCFSMLTKGLAGPLASGERNVQQDPCRVAVSLSGDPRSFADPAVHRSFRRYVVESIQKSDCDVHIFAYAMLEDDLGFFLPEEVGCMPTAVCVDTCFTCCSKSVRPLTTAGGDSLPMQDGAFMTTPPHYSMHFPSTTQSL